MLLSFSADNHNPNPWSLLSATTNPKCNPKPKTQSQFCRQPQHNPKSQTREIKKAKKSKSFPLHTFSPISPANWAEKIVSLERNLLGPTSFLFLIFSSLVQSNGGKLAFTLSLFLPSYFPLFLLPNQTDPYICKVFYLLFSFSLISSVQSNGGKLSFTFYIFLPSYFPPFLLSNQQTLTFVKSLSTILFLLNDLEKNKKIVINFGFPKNNDTFFP